MKKLVWVRNNSTSQFTEDMEYGMFKSFPIINGNGKRCSHWSFEKFEGRDNMGYRVYKTIKTMPYLTELKKWANKYVNGLIEE